ncbi:hypothetical protein HDV63DRAFT_367893 [Trichoderma sp. SZMC 28014]
MPDISSRAQILIVNILFHFVCVCCIPMQIVFFFEPPNPSNAICTQKYPNPNYSLLRNFLFERPKQNRNKSFV